MCIRDRYILNTQIFAKRFREVAGRSMIIPKRVGSEEISPQQFQQKADALLNRHRTMENSLLMREAKNEILFGDIDIISLNQFLQSCIEGDARIVHTKVTVPSRLGMSLFMSAFEDLMSMKTRAFLVKDIDPEVLRRLLGTRSLATELSTEQLVRYLEIELDTNYGSGSRLAPMTLARIHKDRVAIKSIFGEHFNDVPKHSSKNQVTLLEEDKISAYYAGGNMYASKNRFEPLT